MTRQELQSEGHLVAYITGELPNPTAREVEALLREDMEVRREYVGLQDTLEQLAHAYGVSPSANIKHQLMEHPSVFTYARLPENRGGFSSTFMVAASGVVALLSMVAAIYFWNKWKGTDDRLAMLTAQNLELAENLKTVNHSMEGMRRNLAVLVSPDFSRIILDGTANAQGAKAVIYWNKEEEEVFINSATMAALPSHQQYQLWALVDGQPVDAGVFDAREGAFQIMKNIARADAFAVTVERQGGAKGPTLETMQVYGEVI